ncbi:oligopeptide ABC transporter permease [Cetobacterium sp.]|uniref:oligopeptide ABC transporter permease n=1 Tax=Cetobacterium sp. TaxID=2071632 RepID=UPI003F2A63C8
MSQEYENMEEREKSIGPWMMIWIKFKRNKLSLVGLCIFSLIILAIALGPIFSSHTRDFMNYKIANTPPTSSNWLGTDSLGRDYLTRLLHGGRISIQVGFLATSISVFIGIIIGGTAGFYGGKIDSFLMRGTEIFSSFPFLPFAITLSAIFGGRVSPAMRMYIIMSIIGVLGWTGLARMIRGQILSLREQEFMLAAKAIGISNRKQIFKHLIPNTFAYIIVNATLSIAGAILTESGLSFLGLGVVEPVPTWGNMIQAAQNPYILSYRPWLWIPPGLAIFLTVMSINLVGDGLRDAIDPKSDN